MKKIFAIALALVMVLSMASAFASACVQAPTLDWYCATATCHNCGKATVEVIPYVKVNDCWLANPMYRSEQLCRCCKRRATFTLPLS